MSSIEVIFTNKTSQINKETIDFFRAWMSSELKKHSQLFFNFKIAYPQEQNEYINKGITTFPALLLSNGGKYFGLLEIKKYLSSLTVAHVQVQKPQPKNAEQELDDYWKKSIGGLKLKADKKGFDLPEEEEENMPGEEVLKTTSIKNTKFQHPSNKQTEPKTLPLINQSTSTKINPPTAGNGKSIVNNDDELMAKYFSNLEETIL